MFYTSARLFLQDNEKIVCLKVKKILIIRFSSIGDIVLTTPVIRCLKQQIAVELHFLTKSVYKNILSPNPHLDKIWTIDKEIDEVIRGLKAEKYDHIIDLHHNLRTLRVKLNLGVPSASFPKLNTEKWLLTNLKINQLPDIHIVDRYFETVKKLGVKNDSEGLDYFIPSNEEIDTTQYGFAPYEYIAFAIGAKFATKQLPTHKIIEICKALPYPTVLLGGKEDTENGNLISEKSGTHILNACGRFSLHGSASWVEQSRLLITHDTGLMHIGAAFKKRIISIWGNTVPAFGMFPYQTDYEIIEVNDLKCRPCSKIGYQACPKAHFRCMEEIDVGKILKQIT